jgi:hypothetical protein
MLTPCRQLSEPHDITEVYGGRTEGLCDNKLTRYKETAYESEIGFLQSFYSYKYLLPQPFMQQIFCFVLLNNIVLSPLLDKIL